MKWSSIRWIRRLDRLALRVRESVSRLVWPTTIHPQTLLSPLGHTLPCRLHLPRASSPCPGVLLVSGGLDGADSTESLQCVLPAQRLARAGFAVLVFTPSGREGAPGTSDSNGPVQQAECAEALALLLDQPQVVSQEVMVLSLSFGLVMALGGLAQRPDLRVRGLIDWEGPGSRRWFAATRIGAAQTDEDFWGSREAVRLIAGQRLDYRRFQSDWDHVHGADTEIGWEMVQAAVAGGCSRVRLNDHTTPLPPLGRIDWASGFRSRQGTVLLRWLIEGLGGAMRGPVR